MKAAFIRATGPPSCIEYGELPEPAISDQQVLIRVEAAALNPIDTYIRNGDIKFPLPLPWIPGCDFCGVVQQSGSGVTRFAVGDRVWGSNQGLFGRQGTFAEFCAVDQHWLYPVPDGVSSEAAAAGALVGITAHLGLFLHAGLCAGEVVFVNGGTGGVGSSVVQLAKAAGATVITTAGSELKATHCRQLGADHVIQYRTEDIDQAFGRITGITGPVQLWFETLRIPALDRCIPLMAQRGRIVLMAGRDARPEFPVGPFYVKDLRAIGFAMFNATPDEQRNAAEELNRWHSAGRWTPQISRVLPLSSAAEAHQLQEANTLRSEGTLSGKIVLKPD